MQVARNAQKALLKQGYILQGNGLVRTVTFQNKGTGREYGGGIRQAGFHSAFRHGLQKLEHGKAHHGSLDDGTAGALQGRPFLFRSYGEGEGHAQFTLFLHGLLAHAHLDEGREAFPDELGQVKVSAGQRPVTVAEIVVQAHAARNHEGAQVRRLVEHDPLVHKTGEGELLDAETVQNDGARIHGQQGPPLDFQFLLGKVQYVFRGCSASPGSTDVGFRRQVKGPFVFLQGEGLPFMGITHFQTRSRIALKSERQFLPGPGQREFGVSRTQADGGL